MTVAFRAFFTATFATIKRWKIVFFLFVFNAIFGLLVSLPLIADIHALGGYFGGLDDFVRSFDPEIYHDFTNQTQSAIGGAAFGIWGLVYFFLFNILTAGAIGILVDPRESTTLKTFFKACGQYCFRFCRLAVYFVIVLYLINWINSLLSSTICWYFEGSQEYGAGSEMLGWTLFAKNVFMSIVLGFGLLSFVYAKTAAVIEDGHFMGYYFLRGIGFTFSHVLTTGLFLILSLIPLGLVILFYVVVRKTIDLEGSYPILEGILPWKWVLSGAVVYIVLAQAVQFLIQACLFFRMAGQVSIFKRFMGQAAYPDPDLHKNIPEAYFVVDSPGTASAKAKKKEEDEKAEGK